MRWRLGARLALTGTALAVLVGCTTANDRASPPQAGAAQAQQGPSMAATSPLETVETLENRLRRLDEDGDDFIDRREAEAFYRWRFERLDDNGDGRLSRAELQVELPGVPDAETAIEELAGVSEDEYARAELGRFGGRAGTTGMMSTADFHDMVRNPASLSRDWSPWKRPGR